MRATRKNPYKEIERLDNQFNGMIAYFNEKFYPIRKGSGVVYKYTTHENSNGSSTEGENLGMESFLRRKMIQQMIRPRLNNDTSDDTPLIQNDTRFKNYVFSGVLCLTRITCITCIIYINGSIRR